MKSRDGPRVFGHSSRVLHFHRPGCGNCGCSAEVIWWTSLWVPAEEQTASTSKACSHVYTVTETLSCQQHTGSSSKWNINNPEWQQWNLWISGSGFCCEIWQFNQRKAPRSHHACFVLVWISVTLNPRETFFFVLRSHKRNWWTAGCVLFFPDVWKTEKFKQ